MFSLKENGLLGGKKVSNGISDILHHGSLLSQRLWDEFYISTSHFMKETA